MKRMIYALAVASMAMAGCSNPNGYQIKGTVEGAADGDTVYILRMEKRHFIPQDTAIIKNEEFTFKGVQDSTVNLLISYAKGDKQFATDFFLENAPIRIQLGEESTVSGTAINETYQTFKTKLAAIQTELQNIYNAMRQDSLQEEEREAMLEAMDAKDKEMLATLKTYIKDNIGNAVGLHLLSQYYYNLEYPEIEELIKDIPASSQSHPFIVQITKVIDKSKATAIGQKFVDFEMPDLEGKTVKLSDFIAQNKYTLVDFWASWCGPCRQEMPNLVDAYAKYKDKGLGIVGVSLDNNAESWKSMVKQLNITWPQMSDLQGWQSMGADIYAVRSIPHTVLIAQDGTIIDKNLREKALQDKLAELFK